MVYLIKNMMVIFMKYNFGGFTQKANDALNMAIVSAEKLGHTYVGSEHLLQCLPLVKDCMAAQILESNGVNSDNLEEIIKKTVGYGSEIQLTPEKFTPRAKRIIEISVAGTREMGNSFTGTEHILIGILSEGDNYAIRFINELGGDIDVKATGVLNAEYTLFTEDSTNSVSYAEGATITLGDGVIYGDPLFVTSFDTAKSKVTNPFGSNFTYFDTTAANVGKLTEFNLHLRGGRGYYDEKTGALVTDYKSKNVLSPAMDAGNKSSSYAQERDRGEGWHGRRVNLGAYGNTPWATMTTFPGSVIRIR